MDHLKASDWKRLGWILSIVAYVGVNCLLETLYVAKGPVFPGLLAGAAAWMFCNYKANVGLKLLSAPEIKTYRLKQHEVMQILTDTVPNINLEDRWWIKHWENKLKGEMKFRANYELPSEVKGRQYDKQQIVLDVYLTNDNGNIAVKLVFTPPGNMTPNQTDTANHLINHTTDAIDYQLKLAEQGKL